MYAPLGSYVAAPGAYTSFPAMPATGYPQFRPNHFGAPPMGSFVGAPQMGSFIGAAPRQFHQVPAMSNSPPRIYPGVQPGAPVIADMGSFVAPPLPAMAAPVTTAPVSIMRDLGSFVAPPLAGGMGGMMDLGSFVAPPMTSRPAIQIARPTIQYAAPQTMIAGEESAYRYCPECGAENPAKAKCCMECGSKMGEATTYTEARAPIQPAATYAAPSIYATATYGSVARMQSMGSMTAPPLATTYGRVPPVMYTAAPTRAREGGSSAFSPTKPADYTYSAAAENVTGVDI